MKKRFNFNLWTVLLLICLLALWGCESNSSGVFGAIKLPDACDMVEGPSKLCDLAAENNVNLSMVADGLGLANIIAIEKGLYTEEQAVSVLVGLKAFMENPVTYAAFKTELTDTIAAYPYMLQTVDRYVNALVSTQIMFPEDQRLIMGWLDRLIAGLSPD
ncbi:MAG: hypothetical protein MI862_26760 [Desulfobacterales bacterium]|nr:hypothetical protein [Desulfobacterales bacterium]